jgi:ribosome biogenesis GTPase
MDKQFKNSIETLGFDEQFYATEFEKASGFVIARVTSVHKDRCTISDGECEIFAEMSGKFLLNAGTAFDYPVAGDWVLVQALDADFSISRLERYLVMIHEGHIHPVVLLSKCDLLSPEEVQHKVAGIHAVLPGIQVVVFSNKTGDGLAMVRALLIPRKTYCLLGSSDDVPAVDTIGKWRHYR